jgi:Uncharacterized protein conserved in bacteria (DUF2188)
MPTIQERQLQMPDQNNPQIREYIDAIEHGKNTLHIFRTEDGWKLKKIGGNDLGIFDTEKDAISAARRLHSGADSVITHDERGFTSGTFIVTGSSSPQNNRWNILSWFK